jgi:hypothetical protein
MVNRRGAVKGSIEFPTPPCADNLTNEITDRPWADSGTVETV